MTKEPRHKIFRKKGSDGKVIRITCFTCNTSYQSVKLFLKDHLNILCEEDE